MPDAKADGVVMCMENHYKDGLWQHPSSPRTSRRYLAILDAVDTPRLKAQYDPSNAIVADEDPYALRAGAPAHRDHPRLGPLSGGRHARRAENDGPRSAARLREVLKHGVIGKGLNDYDRIFAMLAEAGFSGWVSIEDGEGPTVQIGMDNLRQSASFLRERIARNFTAPCA